MFSSASEFSWQVYHQNRNQLQAKTSPLLLKHHQSLAKKRSVSFSDINTLARPPLQIITINNRKFFKSISPKTR